MLVISRIRLEARLWLLSKRSRLVIDWFYRTERVLIRIRFNQLLSLFCSSRHRKTIIRCKSLSRIFSTSKSWSKVYILVNYNSTSRSILSSMNSSLPSVVHNSSLHFLNSWRLLSLLASRLNRIIMLRLATKEVTALIISSISLWPLLRLNSTVKMSTQSCFISTLRDLEFSRHWLVIELNILSSVRRSRHSSLTERSMAALESMLSLILVVLLCSLFNRSVSTLTTACKYSSCAFRRISLSKS